MKTKSISAAILVAVGFTTDTIEGVVTQIVGGVSVYYRLPRTQRYATKTIPTAALVCASLGEEGYVTFQVASEEVDDFELSDVTLVDGLVVGKDEDGETVIVNAAYAAIQSEAEKEAAAPAAEAKPAKGKKAKVEEAPAEPVAEAKPAKAGKKAKVEEAKVEEAPAAPAKGKKAKAEPAPEPVAEAKPAKAGKKAKVEEAAAPAADAKPAKAGKKDKKGGDGFDFD